MNVYTQNSHGINAVLHRNVFYVVFLKMVLNWNGDYCIKSWLSEGIP